MTLYTVEGVSTLGTESVIFVPTMANINTPKLTEVGNGVATAINLSWPLRGFEPQSDQGTSTDVRLASVVVTENPGRVTITLNDITYVYDPQAATGTASNKHFETLKQGVKGYLVDRRGISVSTIPAIGQFVDVYYVQFGPQRRVAVDPSAEGGKYEIVQKPFVINTAFDVALIA